MDIQIREKADLMIRNFYELKKGFKWDTSLIKHFGAMTHATNGKYVDIERIQEIKSYIKGETGLSSYFRGTNEFLFANLLSFEEDYKSFFKDMLYVYDRMREKGFKRSAYLPLAAYTIVKETSKGDWNYGIDRMDRFYRKMKENHYWLTSADDYVFAAVLAVSGLEVEETVEKIEACYRFLNTHGFSKGNDLQTLSHVLAIGEEDIEIKCNRAVILYEKLKKAGCKLHYSGLATLGVITLIAADEQAVVDEIREIYDYIYEKDGYGFWSLDKNMRTILAAVIASDHYVDEIKKGVIQVALGNSINAIIIAQQQAAVAAACAACTAAASSSGS